MIEVSIKVIPHGDARDTFEAVKLRIINTLDHPRRPEVGNYRIEVLGAGKGPPKEFLIRGHTRSQGLLALVRKVMRAVPRDTETWPDDFLPARLRAIAETLTERTLP